MTTSHKIQSSRAEKVGRLGKRMSLAPSLIMATNEEQQPERSNHNVKDFLCHHMKTIVTLFMIFGTIAVIVLIVMVHKWRWESQLAQNERACLDVAIVGAGISGTYTAWRLRQSALKIHVFELSDRIGGRFYSRHLDGVHNDYAELGALYYLPQYHRRLNMTIHALNLKPTQFHPQSPDHVTYYLRGVHLLHQDLNNTTKVPYRLKEEEKNKNPDQLRSMYINKLVSNDSYPITHPLTATTKDGKLLRNNGYWNLLGKVASQEGYNFLYDTTRWRSLLSNENAALLGSIDVEPRGRKMTVSGGMDRIPKRLAHEFVNASDLHQVRKNRRLACIRKNDKTYKLIFWETKTKDGITTDTDEHDPVCARNVVLAMPKPAIEKVEWDPLLEDTKIMENLACVQEIPALMIYFEYKTKWWENVQPSDHIIITDLPIRQTMYSGRHGYKKIKNGDTSPSNHLLLVASVDANDVDYFTGMIDKYRKGKQLEDNNTCSKSSQLVQDISKQLAQLYKIPEKDIPAPCSVLIRDWSRSPSGGGWFIWKKGVEWDTVQKDMLRPSRRDNVFVVGSAYCGGHYQLWAEGALETVEEMFKWEFDTRW